MLRFTTEYIATEVFQKDSHGFKIDRLYIFACTVFVLIDADDDVHELLLSLVML